MKQLKFVLVVNIFLLFSCSDENIDSNSSAATPQITTEKAISLDTNDQTSGEDGLREKKDSLRISNNTDKNREHLKVIINGEVYYKKNASDFRLDNTYVFRTKDNRFDYDIRSGGSLPSGDQAGPAKVRKRKDVDSINREPK